MYKIKVDYQTGDSFGTEDTYIILEYDWEDFDTVAQNLKRIEEHYQMYKELYDSYMAPYKEMEKKYGDRDWFVESMEEGFDSGAHTALSLYLYLDDGRKFQFSCPWCGYFEKLYGAGIMGPSFEIDD